MSSYQKKKMFLEYIKKLYKKMKKYDLTLDDALQKNIIPSESFQGEGSYKFIKHIKNGDFSKSMEFLKKNKRLIFEYDLVWQNCYHIAAKRGNSKLLYYLIKFRGDVDAKDLTGRTPLMWAVEIQNADCVRLLLAAGAYPFVSKVMEI